MLMSLIEKILDLSSEELDIIYLLLMPKQNQPSVQESESLPES